MPSKKKSQNNTLRKITRDRFERFTKRQGSFFKPACRRSPQPTSVRLPPGVALNRGDRAGQTGTPPVKSVQPSGSVYTALRATVLRTVLYRRGFQSGTAVANSGT